ncbi:protein kinase domain-containing protein [Tautonia rosea]|uniref:serine/threonine-protein kinase n=1 Tax=Tautonia rosea TaxID=2728037 RepID=UPI001F324A33|nr:serine/threonine-protein kinase [Tautonia rosea]
MSDRGSSFQDDSLDFDPAVGWNLRPESFAEFDDLDSTCSDHSDSHEAPGDLLTPPGDLRGDFDYSMHLRPSDSPLQPSEPLGPRQRPSASSAQGSWRYPRTGEQLAGFRIVGELGRGAFARVYLAEQENLADRQVALKVSNQPVGEESQLLARLQHSHIVPIHSVHEDLSSGLHLICMPYLGGANLAQVLEAASAESSATSRNLGGSLIDALDLVCGPLPSLPASRMAGGHRQSSRGQSGSRVIPPSNHASSPASRPIATATSTYSRLRVVWNRSWSWITGGSLDQVEVPRTVVDSDRAQPARHYLRHASAVQASVWIAARLAEGLEHAHSRGLLHRDLKPSNILITADGMPMILDFNLSAVANPGDEGKRARIGGTLPYMAPEHLDAFHPRGSTPSHAVDERSDLYSLGLILFEMVTGRQPFRDPPDGPPIAEVLDQMIVERLTTVPSARAINSAVPWSLDALLRKCLDPNPAKRYQHAGDLAEDLRRFLEDRPARHAPEPSLHERFSKLMRRNPHLKSSTTVGALAVILLIIFALMFVAVRERWHGDAARVALQDFENDFTRCQILLNSSTDLDLASKADLERGLTRARMALARYGVDHLGPDWVDGPMVRTLHTSDRQNLIDQVVELLMLEARASIVAARDGPESDYAAALIRAVHRLDLAEQIDPRPPSTLFAERATYAAALGLSEQAERDRLRADAIPPKTARDYYLRGTAALANGQIDQAEDLLDRATGLDPRRFWSWFALGLCHFEQERYDVAASDFAICIILNARSSQAFANRGLALAMDGRPAEARRAYDEAVILDPDLIPARINRALVCLELEDPAQAADDLQYAIESTRSRDPALLATWAEALARSGSKVEADHRFGEALKDRPGDPVILVARGFVRLPDAPGAARDDFERALKADPRSPRAHLGIAHVVRAENPSEALEHLDTALATEPNLIDAVQLRALVRARLGMRSAVADVDTLRRFPTAHRLYNAASALAVLCETTSDNSLKDDALALLRRAIDAGFDPSFAASDPDLNCLRSMPAFQKLVLPK